MDVPILWGELIASSIMFTVNRPYLKPVAADDPRVKAQLVAAVVRVVLGFIFLRAFIALNLHYLGVAS